MAKARGSKVVSHAARKTREAMVAKLAELIVREYPGVPLSTAYKRIQDTTGISLSTMQRIMSGTNGPSIDTLSDLARSLGSTVAEIVTIGADDHSKKTIPFPNRQNTLTERHPPKSSRTPPY